MRRLLALLPLLLLGATFRGGDAPEISRSVGSSDGLVVLWPRVVPSAGDPVVDRLTLAVQQRLAGLAERQAPAGGVDVRPSPERVCPRSGCRAPTLGAVLAHYQGGCAVVAVLGAPGTGEQRLVPWAAEVELASSTVPFREPPESAVTVLDFVPCAGLEEALTEGEARVLEALSAR